MSNAYARAKGGKRVKMPIPFRHGPQFSMIGAISWNKVEAALYGEWPVNGDIFHVFVKECLLPRLKPEHVVIMDNVGFHLQERIREAVQSSGAKIIFLPPYSPDLNPIENMWSKVKNTLRKLAPRTKRSFKKCIKIAFEQITKTDLIQWFKHCGYWGGPFAIPL